MDFLQAHIDIIFYVSGIITMLPVFQFLCPVFFREHILKITITEKPGQFYFAHWGVVVFSLSLLMIYAGAHAELRVPVAFVVLLEKAILALWVFKNWKEPYVEKMKPAAIFDAVVSVIFMLFLVG